MVAVREAFKDHDGKPSMGRILAFWFGLLAAGPPVFFFAQLGPEIGFWEMVIGSALFGVFSVGFYHGLGVSAFKEFASRAADRIGG